MRPREKRDGTRGLGDVLADLLGARGPLKRPAAALEEARRAWMAAAGEEIAAHTRVRSLRAGVLTVEVDSPALCHRLSAFEKERLLLGIKERVRKAPVCELRLRLGAFVQDEDHHG